MSDDESGLGRAVLNLLLALSELQEQDRAGQQGRPLGTRSDAHLSVDTGISVGSLDDNDGPRQSSQAGHSTEGNQNRDDILVERRETEDGVTVIVDFSTQLDGDVSAIVEAQRDELVVMEDEDTIYRISLNEGPWTIAEVRHNNGIVEVLLQNE